MMTSPQSGEGFDAALWELQLSIQDLLNCGNILGLRAPSSAMQRDRSTVRLETLVEQFSFKNPRFGAGAGMVEVGETTKQALEVIEGVCASLGISLTSSLPSSASAHVCLDDLKLSQLLFCLASFSINRAARGGRRVWISLNVAFNEVFILFANDGPIISDQDWAFFLSGQAKQGWGVQAARKLIESGRGRIWTATTTGSITWVCTALPRVGVDLASDPSPLRSRASGEQPLRIAAAAAAIIVFAWSLLSASLWSGWR